jgi:hypothetical protein
MFLGLFTSGIQAFIFATLAGAYIDESMEDRWGDSSEIQCRSNFPFTRGIRAFRGGPPWLLSSWESIHPLSVYRQLSLEHRFRFGLNEKNKMKHLTTYLHRPRTTRSPLSFWGDLDFLYKSFSKLIKRVTRFNRAFKDFLIFLYFKLIILMFLNCFYAFISKTNLKNKNIILIYF